MLVRSSNTVPCGSSSLIQNTPIRSEEHTSELQSRLHLVCRLLLEKKKSPAPLNKFIASESFRVRPLRRAHSCTAPPSTDPGSSGLSRYAPRRPIVPAIDTTQSVSV